MQTLRRILISLALTASSCGQVGIFSSNASQFTGVYNEDDSLSTPATWTQCFKPGCDPGGPNTPTLIGQTIGNSSPSKDGGSMLLTIQGPGNSNVLFGAHNGAHNTATKFQLDLWAQVDTAQFQALEFDLHQNISNNLWQFGTECSKGSGFWQVWNALSGVWVNTSLSCSFGAGVWHHLIFNFHRIAGNTGCSGQSCMFYDDFIFDGVPFAFNVSEPSVGIVTGDDLGIDIQLDQNGTATTINENVDLVTIRYQ